MYKGKKSKLVLIVFLCFLFYFAVSFVNQQRILYVKQQRYETLQAQLAEEKNRHSEIIKDIEIIESNEYIEKVAREKLGMVRRDEKIFYDMDK